MAESSAARLQRQLAGEGVCHGDEATRDRRLGVGRGGGARSERQPEHYAASLDGVPAGHQMSDVGSSFGRSSSCQLRASG